MSFCINLNDKQAVAEFNEVLSRLNGLPITTSSIDEYKASLSPNQLNSYYRAYKYWNDYEGDLTRIANIIDYPTEIYVYQGYNGIKDNRKYNYYTLSQSEAKDYGSNIETKRIDTVNFLHKWDNNSDTLEYSEQYDELANKFKLEYGKRFDILDNTKEGLNTQEAFFKFIESEGFKGYSELYRNQPSGENDYVVTFDEPIIYNSSSRDLTKGIIEEERLNSVVQQLTNSIQDFKNLKKIYKNNNETWFKTNIDKANVQLKDITFEDLQEHNQEKILLGITAQLLFFEQTINGNAKYDMLPLMEQLEVYSHTDFAKLRTMKEEDLKFRQFMINLKNFIVMFSDVHNLQNPYNENGDLIESQLYTAIEDLRKLGPKIDDINNAFSAIIRDYYYNFIMQYTSNPNYTGAKGNIEDIVRMLEMNDDISSVMYWLDTPYTSGVPFIDNIMRDYNRMVSAVEKETMKLNDEFEQEFLKVFPDFKNTLAQHKQVAEWFKSNFMEVNDKGQVTPRLITKYKFNEFYKAKEDYYARQKAISKQIEDLKKLVTDTREAQLKKQNELSRLYAKSKYEKDKWYSEHEDRTTSKELTDLVAEKQATLSLDVFERWKNKENLYWDKYDKVWYKFKPREQYINKAYSKLMDNNDNPIGKNGAFYKYLITAIPKLLDFNTSLLQPEGFLPMIPNVERSNWTSFISYFGFRDEYSQTNEMVGIGNELVNLLSLNGLQQLGSNKLYAIPQRKEKESDMEYNDRVVEEVNSYYHTTFTSADEIFTTNASFKEKNAEETAMNMDFDIINVMKIFTKNAVEYKHKKAYESQVMLGMHTANNELRFYSNKTDGSLIKNWNKSVFTGDNHYHTVRGNEALVVKRLKEFYDMNFYGKKVDTNTLEKVAKMMMRISSMNLMWFNVKAGVVNITGGYLRMLEDAGSSQYLSIDDLKEATKDYLRNVAYDVMANRATHKANTLPGGLTKLFSSILTLKMETGITSNKDIKNVVDQVLAHTDAFYFANSAGEHFMQFTMLLGMLRSHKLINGKIMSFNDYTNLYSNVEARADIFKSILTTEQLNELELYISNQRKLDEHPNRKNDYIGDWVRTQVFNGKLTKAQQNAYITAVKEFKAKAKEQFDKEERLYDKFELVDGIARPKEDSGLTDDLISEFQEKVLAVNESFQGVYTELGRSHLQYSVLGEMLSQYRKWMKPSWNRYFGIRFNKGIWEERTKSWQKGAYVSAWHFLTTPFRGKKFSITRKSPDDITMIEAMKNLVKDYGSFIRNMNFMWNSMDDYEKANCKRALYNFAEILGLGLLIMLTNALADDDDEERTISAIMLYELSAVYTDLSGFVPGPGMYGMVNRFWNSPTATYKTSTNMYKLAAELFMYPFQDEKERVYQTGIYHGEDKLYNLFKKNVPIWNQINSIRNMPALVSYYGMYTPFWADKSKRDE